ncbi:MAG: phenylalanine--tRNA ligase subunit alpha [Chlamydiales bacterium]|nr:phenylalanine--tRNA ligase subunit alpha [Chlamydiales bacterium]NCF70393.1 phenylalanine--tRNA ligase subunit alpha [Chlamydiales bacterium]
MQQKIQEVAKQAEQELSHIQNSKECEQLMVKYLGKKGIITDLMKMLKDVEGSQKPQLGKAINDLKQSFQSKSQVIYQNFLDEDKKGQMQKERLDISQPGRRKKAGHRHLISQMMEQILEVWHSLGFTVQYAPDVESDYYNFQFLNFAENHPAKDMQDTFYVTENELLRTHNSTIQGRIMSKEKPPIRVVSPGKCYRNETITVRSHVLFHQVDAVYIDKGVTFSDLLSTLEQFCKKLLGKEVKTRFRASYFPFVEPGLEIDVSCLICKGSGCNICKHSGWLEIAGAGMVHPEVIKNANLDPEEYTGFALGMGVERLVLVRHGIEDIRMLLENDVRFLEQF